MILINELIKKGQYFGETHQTIITGHLYRDKMVEGREEFAYTQETNHFTYYKIIKRKYVY